MESSSAQHGLIDRSEREAMSDSLPAWCTPQPGSDACGIVLVGPGQHFGLELIQRFVDGGCRVAVVSASQSALTELQQQLITHRDRVFFRQADVSQAQAFADCLKEVASCLGRVDGLIYNSKHSVKGTGLAVQVDELDYAMSVNITGAVIAIQTLLPYLRTQRGRVILTGGGYKDHPDAGKFALSVGKAGMHGIFKAIREPLRRQGIDVSTIIIDGAVRRSGLVGTPAAQLADFYWHVFSHRSRRVHHFPDRLADKKQLRLFP